MREDRPLTDAEYWILLSLDDAALLPELLSPIVERMTRRSRLPWRRWEDQEIRPKLSVDDAATAVANLVAASLVEVRQVRRDALDEAEQVPIELLDGQSIMGWPHPFGLGRALRHEDVLRVVTDERNWRYAAETDSEFEYWVGITEAGEAAYRRSGDQRSGRPPGGRPRLRERP
jgi:hypothetical protein